MKAGGLILLVSLSLCGAAHGAVTFELLGTDLASDISDDGSVIVGNTQGDYETFRWTAATGSVHLGLATAPVLGVGAGVPEVSADGTRISATILGADSSYATQGRWTLGQGWEELMPPVPPDGGLMDQAYGSSWGLSEDGETLVGLYWRPGQPGGSAHPSRWTASSGVVDLGTPGWSGRANDADGDGSVVAGWVEHSSGVWQPTVWVDGVRTILRATEGFCEAEKVNSAGTVVIGSSWIPGGSLADAALWRWNGSAWVEQILGHLPGTFPNYGYVTCTDLTANAGVIVGYNRFDFSNSTGFVWTQAGGMVSVTQFLTSHGVTVPAGITLASLSAISANGEVMVGTSQDTAAPFTRRTFVIRMNGASAVESTMPAVDACLRLASNPTRGATDIGLDLAQRTDVNLALFSADGRLVRRLVDGAVAAGHRGLRWDGRDVTGAAAAPGVYFLRLETNSHQETQKLIVVR